MKMSLLAWTIVVLLCGIVIGGCIGAAIFSPTKANLDILTMAAIRLGWLCHDNDVSYDECILHLERVNR